MTAQWTGFLFRFAFCLSPLAFALAGCGYVGEPLPPALRIPSRVTDLRAVEYGGNIVVEFTAPELSTEGLGLRKLLDAELRIQGAQSQQFPIAVDKPGAVRQEVPAREWIGQEVSLAVRTTGPKGRVSEWSNAVKLRVAPPLAPPSDLKAESAPEGVRLTWQSPAARFRIFRDQALAGESDKPEYIDTTAQFGKEYEYFVQALAEETQQSEISAAVKITPADTFPPAAPAGLAAIAGPGTIELAWERNLEPDFRAYRIYRAVEGGPFERIADAVEAPAYSDRAVEPGKQYRYRVSALDQAGNESPPSAEAEITAQ